MRCSVYATLPLIATGRVRLCATLVALALAACVTTPERGTAPGPHDADAAAIRSARFAQNEAIAVGDLDGIAAFWTDDVVVRPGLGPLIVGRDAYRRTFASDPPGTVFVRRPTAIEVGEQWPLAFETGEWSWHLAGALSPAIVAGRYSAQWVKRNGRWLIRAEIFVPLSCDAGGCDRPAAP
jgi:ketosteroid isomerase-like protein